MSMPKTHTEWIRLVATPSDKALLEAITKKRQNKGFSTTVRQLIREEAKRARLAGSTQISSQPRSEQAA